MAGTEQGQRSNKQSR